MNTTQRKIRFLTVAAVFGFSGLFCLGGTIETSRSADKQRTVPVEVPSFSFAIVGDRTTGRPEDIAVLRQAVQEINMMGPDFVMTVGDMIQGYNQAGPWRKEAEEFTEAMNQLNMPWFPAAGNHDVYWRGANRPADEHEGDYEKTFGPLWYAFEHKGCLFVVLFTDEGNPATGRKTFNEPECQVMSDTQKQWLKEVLEKNRDAEQVFCFQHHPRWLGTHYGDDWDYVHKLLNEAQNVSAVFGGHYHRMQYDRTDGIDYYVLGTTGGGISDFSPDRQHFWYWVTVRGDEYGVTAIPVQTVVDVKDRQMKSVTLIPERTWDIQSKDQVVELEISTKGHAFEFGKIDIRLDGAWDDSGDHALAAALLDADRKVINEGKSRNRGSQWMTFAARADTVYYLQLKDPDAVFEGPDAGNQGSVEVVLSYYIEPQGQ